MIFKLGILLEGLKFVATECDVVKRNTSIFAKSRAAILIKDKGRCFPTSKSATFIKLNIVSVDSSRESLA